MFTRMLEFLGMVAALGFWCVAFVWVAIKLEKSERRLINQKPNNVEIHSDQPAENHTQKKTGDKCLHG